MAIFCCRDPRPTSAAILRQQFHTTHLGPKPYIPGAFDAGFLNEWVNGF